MSQEVTTPKRYSHGKIYKIIDNTTGVFYIGSTAVNRIRDRLRLHINSAQEERYKNRKKYSYFTPNKLRSEDVQIVVLEEISAENKEELLKLENDYVQREMRNVLCVNTRCPTFDYVNYLKYQKEYDDKREHTEKRKIEKKKYRMEYNKLKVICGCGKTVSKSQISTHLKSEKHNLSTCDKEIS